MLEANRILPFLRPLNRMGTIYMVTGSVAAIIYGQPRLTHDIDLVIKLDKNRVLDFINAYPTDQFYCPPPEVILNEIARETRGHFILIHNESGFKADIYPLANDPLHKWALERRKETLINDKPLWLAPPEYVILRKLEYYREGGSTKHITDIQVMLEVSSDIIDRQFLEEKIDALGLAEQWGRVNE